MGITLKEVNGMNPVDADRLKMGGIHNAKLLAYQDPGLLADEIGLREADLQRLVTNVRNMLPNTKLRPAAAVETELKHRSRLSTGIKGLDRLLQGGFTTGSVIEIHGPPRSGKTQWCHQLAVTSQLSPEEGGLEGEVIWLDCERGFTPLIIRADALRFGLDPDAVMSNIRHVSILTQSHMVDYLSTLTELCSEDIALVVCDCLGMLFPAELDRKDHYETTVSRLGTVLETFSNLTLATESTFLYTNQVYSRFVLSGGSYLWPLNNNLMGQMSDYRFKARARSPPDGKMFNLVDAPDIPPFEYRASLSWGGFYDLSDRIPPEGVIEYVNKQLAARYQGTIDDDEEPLYT